MRGKKWSLDESTRHEGSMEKLWYLVTVSAIWVRDGVASRVIVVVVAVVVLRIFASIVAVVIVVISVVRISAWTSSNFFLFWHNTSLKNSQKISPVIAIAIFRLVIPVPITARVLIPAVIVWIFPPTVTHSISIIIIVVISGLRYMFGIFRRERKIHPESRKKFVG